MASNWVVPRKFSSLALQGTFFIGKQRAKAQNMEGETSMKENIALIAQRIRDLRDILEISAAEMAEAVGMSEEEYLSYETGEKDFSFSFLYTVAD